LATKKKEMTMNDFIEWLKKWSLAALGFGLVVLYTLLGKRNRTITALQQDAEVNKLAPKLAELKEESHAAHQVSEQASTDYDTLKQSNAELLKRIGVTEPDSQ
jgi:hypothetical protein